jgi:hypothetical protein
VSSQEPLWEAPVGPRFVTGLATRSREVIATSVLDGQPDHRYLSPKPSPWPFIAAVLTAAWFVWSVFQIQALWWGIVPVGIALIAWFWPTKDETAEHLALEKRP